MKEKANLPPSFLEKVPWTAESIPFWPVSVLKVRRNLKHYCFPGKVGAHEAARLSEMIQNGLKPLIPQANLFKEEELSFADREFIHEYFLQEGNFQETPNGALFMLNPDASLLATLSRGNHLELHLLESRGNLQQAWTLLSKMENQLSQSLDFAFSPRFGYLTADPAHCGTGFTLSAYLHLPALIHSGKLREIFSTSSDEGILIKGLASALDEWVGDIVILQNNYTLGVAEEEILRDVQAMAAKLIAAEKNLRIQSKSEGNGHLKDLISKAYGLLLHSYQLEAKEVLGLLSLMKLGLDLGWVRGVKDEKLSELFFKCRRGYLSHLFPDSLDLKEVTHKRAQFLHEQVKGIELNM